MKVEEINATMLGLAEKMRRDGYSENTINTTKWVINDAINTKSMCWSRATPPIRVCITHPSLRVRIPLHE